MKTVLIVIAVFLVLKLFWNLIYEFNWKRFHQAFGFYPPQGKDKLALQAYQGKVDRRLRELASSEPGNEERAERLRAEYRKTSIWNPRRTELYEEWSQAYVCTFSKAHHLAEFFDFQTRPQIEDYL